MLRSIAPLTFAALLLVSCNEKKEQHNSLLIAENSDLEVGKLIGRNKLPQHKTDTFKLNLGKDAFVFGYVEQHDVDVVVKIFGPDNIELATFDSPSRGPELFKFSTALEGIHKVAVTPFQDQQGEYSIMIDGAAALGTTPESRIEQIVTASLGKGDTPGVAISVQRDSKSVYSKGFGYADIEQHAKVTPATVFHIASVSKQFTCFAIAMLADQGKLSVDDDIRKYLPEMHDFGTPITINHLIHHTSGLRDQWNLLTMAGWRMDDVITTKQILRLVSKQTELNYKPGDEMLYCNTGFTLMAEIVHRITKQSFPEWCKQNIFDPLGMNNTLFYDDHERVVMNRAYSYHPGSNGYNKSVLSYANAGATSLFTTVEDLGLWAQNFEKVKVGNENIMKMMDQKFILNSGDTTSYAYGQVLLKYKGLTSKFHSGGDAGFRSFLLRFPDQHFSISVFSNDASFPVAELAYAVTDLYLKKEFKPEPEKEEKPAPQEPPKEVAFDQKSVNLAEFAGNYYSPELETRYTFVASGDSLVSHHQRHDDMKLIPKKIDAFDINILGTLEFYREKGKVAGFRASNGRVRNLKFVKE